MNDNMITSVDLSFNIDLVGLRCNFNRIERKYVMMSTDHRFSFESRRHISNIPKQTHENIFKI